MNKREIRQYEMLTRVREFGIAHGNRFPASTLAGLRFATIGRVVEELTAHAVAQLSAHRQATQARTAARAALVAALDAIKRTARAIEDTPPGFESYFRRPARRHAQALLTAARVAARQAEAVAPSFIAHAMPETFVGDLHARIERFEDAVGMHQSGKGTSAARQVGIKTAITSGLVATRQLDAIVINHLGRDAVTMAEWREASRVQYPKYRKEPAAVIEPPDASVSAPRPVLGSGMLERLGIRIRPAGSTVRALLE